MPVVRGSRRKASASTRGRNRRQSLKKLKVEEPIIRTSQDSSEDVDEGWDTPDRSAMGQPVSHHEKIDSIINGSYTEHIPPALPELFPRRELDDDLLHWLNKASEFFDFDPQADLHNIQLSFVNLRVPIPAYSLARIYAVISTKAHHANAAAPPLYQLSLAEQIALGVIIWTFRYASFGNVPCRDGHSIDTHCVRLSNLGLRCHCQVPSELGILIQYIERAPCVLLCKDSRSTRDAEALLQLLVTDPGIKRATGDLIVATLDSTEERSNLRMVANTAVRRITLDRFLLDPPVKCVLGYLRDHVDWGAGNSDTTSLHFPSIAALHDRDEDPENDKFVNSQMFLIVNLEKFENAIAFGQRMATVFHMAASGVSQQIRISGVLRALVLSLVGITGNGNDELLRIIEEVSAEYLPSYNFRFV